jgi:membrane protease YdiL (CAAX protease family)
MTALQNIDTAAPVAPTRGVAASLGLLIALGLLRTVLLLGTDGVSWLGFRTAGSTEPLRYALLSSNLWIVAVDIVTLVVVARLLMREGGSLRRLLEPRPIGKNLLWGLLAFAILLVAFVVATYVANLSVYQGPPPPVGTTRIRPPLWYGLWAILVMPATIALAEESLYRGYLQPRFQARLGRVGSVVVVAVLFGLQHSAFALGSVQAVVARVLGMILVGLVLGVLYLWLKRLAPLVFAHWLIDVLGLGLPILFLAVS